MHLKVLLPGKFITVNTCIGKEKKSQINNLSLHIKKLEKENKLNPKRARGRI